MAIGYGVAVPKPEQRKRMKARKDRQESAQDAKVRAYVFAREQHMCRICGIRPATSRHELRFRSLGGKVTKENCVAVCGDGIHGCHGFAQRNTILYAFMDAVNGADGTIIFIPKMLRAAKWLRCDFGRCVVSPPMKQRESTS